MTADVLTVALLALLEALLSADNALVLAMMVLGLPPAAHRKALRYGVVGAFAMRTVVTLFAVYVIRIGWVKLFGALYLVYLAWRHFFHSGGTEARRRPPPARPWLGLPPFWATVVKVELVNIAFSVDSILVAVAISQSIWIVLAGGLLGILAIRVVVVQLLGIVRRNPAIVDGAFVIIAWVGVKLLIEFLRHQGVIHFEINRWVSFGLIVVIFAASYLYARRAGRPGDDD
jgi:YkoY family integral membrane protein